jgi:hypothetical protein
LLGDDAVSVGDLALAVGCSTRAVYLHLSVLKSHGLAFERDPEVSSGRNPSRASMERGFDGS